jgi:DNA helicase-4
VGKIDIGDRVHHHKHGTGVVKVLIAHDLAEVQFANSLEYVEQRNLIFLDEFEREQRRREEEARRRAANRVAMKRDQHDQDRRQREIEYQRSWLQRQMKQMLQEDFINAQSRLAELDKDRVMVHEFASERLSFVRSWFESQNGESVSSKKALDDQQLAAIAAMNGHVQVIARAGSGKTATLVNRALFLQKHCGVSPSQMMLLAFNKKAAEEIEDRLGKLLDDRPPFVMTFHALAHALVHPEENLIHDSSDGKNQALSHFVQDVIDARRRDPVFCERIRKVMLVHFREDWDRIQDGGYHLSQEEMLAYRRSLQRETLDGKFVKSYGEKVIANFLFEHQVGYLYEPNERGRLDPYHPDFLIKRSDGTGVCIEYFGMAGDPDYDAMSHEKRRYWQEKRGWTLIECGPQDISANGVEGFQTVLQKALENEGFVFIRMTEDEIWHRVAKRAIDRFSTATKGFIARCRKSDLTPEALSQKIAAHKTKWPVEADFLDIMVDLYEDYLIRLEIDGNEDFDGLLRRATLAISAGQTDFSRFIKKQNGDLANLRFLLIDEYQDFSKLFHSMVEAIRLRSPGLNLFCVGDDWQAINGFAGSDLSYYNNFSSYFPNSERLHISTNYRSAKGIVAVGNAVMAGLPGKPVEMHSTDAGHVWMATPADFPQSPNERTRHGDDNITPMVLRLAAWAIAQDKDIVVLCRTKKPAGINYKAHQGMGNRSPEPGIDGFKAMIRSYFPAHQRPKIKVSTAHGFKGLQGSVVVILDAVAGCYPLIHQDWIFLRLFGESVQTITDESRRLFYVALTRAVDTLVIFTDKSKKSPFLEDIEQKFPLHPISWGAFPAVSAKSDRLKVVVGNQPSRGSNPTFAIKDFLKQEGYSIYSRDSWMRSFRQEGFCLDSLKSSAWANHADGVSVRVFNEQDKLIGLYWIDGGIWVQISNTSVESSLDAPSTC